MVVMLAIHILPKQAATIVPFVLVNLLIEPVFLSKNESLGFLDKMDTDIYEITKETIIELLMSEIILGQSEKLSKSGDGKSICSPADMSVH